MSMARQEHYMTGDGSKTYKSSMSCGPDIAQFDAHSKNNIFADIIFCAQLLSHMAFHFTQVDAPLFSAS